MLRALILMLDKGLRVMFLKFVMVVSLVFVFLCFSTYMFYVLNLCYVFADGHEPFS